MGDCDRFSNTGPFAHIGSRNDGRHDGRHNYGTVRPFAYDPPGGGGNRPTIDDAAPFELKQEVMSDEEKGLILIGLLLWAAWRHESTSVTLTQNCWDGSVIPLDQTCPDPPAASVGYTPFNSPYYANPTYDPNFLNPFAPGQIGDPFVGSGWIEQSPMLIEL